MKPRTLFETTLSSLTSDLARPAFMRAYELARPNHRALQPYASPAAALSALASKSSLPLEERDVVVSALLQERQHSAHPLWQALLLLAFEPMLLRLRTSVGRTRSDDLDQRVLVAFLGALAVVRPHTPYLALVLRRATQRVLYPALKVARREAQNDLFDEETHPPDLYRVEAATRGAEVIRIIEAAGGAELREVILATRGTDETLRAYVERTRPNATPAQRAAAYDRLWRARDAVERQLRESARSESAALVEPAAGAA